MQPFRHHFFLLATLAALVGPQLAFAQMQPLAPVVLSIKLHGDSGALRTWQIGPLTLPLPSSWIDASRRFTVMLKDPAGASAVFVALEATPEARGTSYSLYADGDRGPDAFPSSVSWLECSSAGERKIYPISLAAGRKGMVATCPVPSGQIYAQVALYSRGQLVQVLAVGPSNSIAEFLAALKVADLRE